MAIARTAAGTVASGTSVDLSGASFLVITYQSTGANPTLTYGAGTLTKIFSLQQTWTTSFLNFYYLNNPASGSNTLSTSDVFGNISYIGLSGTSGLDNSNSSTGATSAVSVTPVASNCWTVVAWNGTNTVSLSGGPNTFEAGSSTGVGLGDSEGTVSGAQTQNFTGPGTSNCNLYMLTVAPAVSAATAHLLGTLGVGA